jgi:hypothetical protein
MHIVAVGLVLVLCEERSSLILICSRYGEDVVVVVRAVLIAAAAGCCW